MKRRLGSKTSSGFLYLERPFFDVDVELKARALTLPVHVASVPASLGGWTWQTDLGSEWDSG